MGSLDAGRLVGFVPTVNLPRARAFYADNLGLRVVDESDFACVFDANGTMLRVTPVRKVARARYTVLGWSVDDIEATVRRLTDAGVVFEHYRGMDLDALGIWTAPGGSRVAWFQDLDGNLLSLMEFE
jgi:catechol 2,3-dioxygenase-like lactoylglutathione lyase family enzyme